MDILNARDLAYEREELSETDTKVLFLADHNRLARYTTRDSSAL